MDHPTSLKLLLEQLREEHQSDYVYRGQAYVWSEQLFPSTYRGTVATSTACDFTPEMRLREIGNTFYELSPPTLENYQQKLESLRTQEYLRHVFGYPLSNLFAQQCGVESEGLDVTSDPDVAAFFAIYDFRSQAYIQQLDQLGVIYRFKMPMHDLSIEDLKQINFYTCPTFLDAQKIFTSFEQCSSWGESALSFLEYKAEFGVTQLSDLPRPLEILRFPKDAIPQSRVVQQRAGLIFCDMLLSDYYLGFEIAPPPQKAQKKGMNAIEDLHTRNGLEKFLFVHSIDDSHQLNLPVNRIFPREDPLLALLRAFLSYGAGVGQFIFMTDTGMIQNLRGEDLLK